jgi:hypothetical protein
VYFVAFTIYVRVFILNDNVWRNIQDSLVAPHNYLFYVVHLSGSVTWLAICDYSSFDYNCNNITIGQFVIIFTCYFPLGVITISNNHKLPDSNNFALITKSGVIENCQPIDTTTQMHYIKQLIVTIHEGILNISPNIIVQTENFYVVFATKYTTL